MSYIILDFDQAASVRGADSPTSALEPSPLADGATYVLPADVLADSAHAKWRDLLASLPVRDVAANEWPPSPWPAK